MFEIEGKYNKAKIFATNIDENCISQIMELCNQEWLKDCNIAIMPDCCAGKGCAIGTTIKLKDKVSPSLVGVDIGCGMLCADLGDIEIDLKKLDEFIHKNIPSGFDVNEKEYNEKEYGLDLKELYCYEHIQNKSHIRKSLGTLGGGNHFIEIDIDTNDNKYLIIHSGSRNLGKQICEYYQDIAYQKINNKKQLYQQEVNKLISELKNQGKENEIESNIIELKKNFSHIIKTPKELCYLEGKDFDDYIHDMKIAQEYANINRFIIMDKIFDFILNKEPRSVYIHRCVHNYIDDDLVLRKGAIKSKKGNRLIIPINMRDGTILAYGKINKDYNYSAPHGAGRIMSRSQAKENVSLDEFKESMKNIYTTSVSQSTIDESPMAYKNIDDILENIKDTAIIDKIVKPIYNFKAS